jgi:hypothetical protein
MFFTADVVPYLPSLLPFSYVDLEQRPRYEKA